jgi:hypothetical protein
MTIHMSHPLTRRSFGSVGHRDRFAGDEPIASRNNLPPRSSVTSYKIAACDWMVLKRETPASSWPRLRMDGHKWIWGRSAKSHVSRQLQARSAKFLRESNLGIEICSLAMSGFYGQSFPTREIEKPVGDCIDTMKLMNVKIAFLPLGVQGDLVAHPELRPTVVERLKKIAPAAEQAGVIIGIETALDAAGDKKLLEDVGSSAIKIYFNFSNAIQNGRDLCAELQTLGKDNICQIHCTDQTFAQESANRRAESEADPDDSHYWLVMNDRCQTLQGREVQLRRKREVSQVGFSGVIAGNPRPSGGSSFGTSN